jgi:hypothetical protein
MELGGAEAANKQTNKSINNSRYPSKLAERRRHWHAAARLPRRDHAALGRGSGCAQVLLEQR